MALDFDLACTTRLLYYDAEKEKRDHEAMSGGVISRTLGGAAPNSKVEHW